MGDLGILRNIYKFTYIDITSQVSWPCHRILCIEAVDTFHAFKDPRLATPLHSDDNALEIWTSILSPDKYLAWAPRCRSCFWSPPSPATLQKAGKKHYNVFVLGVLPFIPMGLQHAACFLTLHKSCSICVSWISLPNCLQ